MTRPIRNTGPCFPSGLPRQRGQIDVLSHTEFYTPIFCMLSVFQAIPFELPRKPPTVNRWDSTLGTPGCEVCPRDQGKVVESLWGFFCFFFKCPSDIMTTFATHSDKWALLESSPKHWNEDRQGIAKEWSI